MLLSDWLRKLPRLFGVLGRTRQLPPSGLAMPETVLAESVPQAAWCQGKSLIMPVTDSQKWL